MRKGWNGGGLEDTWKSGRPQQPCLSVRHLCHDTCMPATPQSVLLCIYTFPARRGGGLLLTHHTGSTHTHAFYTPCMSMKVGEGTGILREGPTLSLSFCCFLFATHTPPSLPLYLSSPLHSRHGEGKRLTEWWLTYCIKSFLFVFAPSGQGQGPPTSACAQDGGIPQPLPTYATLREGRRRSLYTHLGGVLPACIPVFSISPLLHAS